MHILIAPNAFKNSLTATEAAKAIEEGIILGNGNFTTECFPIADGGDGTGELIVSKCKGHTVFANVHDPLGNIIRAKFGLIDNGKIAVIEMADASGLRLLDNAKLNPLKASSIGTGELIMAALNQGVKKIIITMGGSATVDGGAGILHALGVRFLDHLGQSLLPQPEKLEQMVSIDISQIDKRIYDCEVIILCDVNNKLLGTEGAAYIFGPQKGASANDVNYLEQFLTLFKEITKNQFGKDMSALTYGGTAGGAAAGLSTYLNAKLVNGIECFLKLTDFETALQKSDIVITGEGSMDLQTLQGKGPFGVAEQARLKNIPVIGLAGRIPVDYTKELQNHFQVLLPIGNSPADLAEAIVNTKANLIRTSVNIAVLLSVFSGYSTFTP